jgi:hypothetical protein
VRYFLCTLIGLALLVASCVAIAYSVYQLLQIGTCASGGPYQVARECPEGTERFAFAIPVAVLTLLIGTGVYSLRGRAPGSDRDPRPGQGMVLLWLGLFLGIAFACFWGVWGPDANPGPGGKLGGLIVGFLFVPMGIGGALMFWFLGPSTSGGLKSVGMGAGDLWRLTRAATSGDVAKVMEASGAKTATTPTSATPAEGGGDAVSEIERADRLRREGAITDAEFERIKKRALERL